MVKTALKWRRAVLDGLRCWVCELWIRSAEPPGVHRLTTAEQYFRKFFKSDEKHKVQDSNEASYTFKKDK